MRNNELLKLLKKDYPSFDFVHGDRFAWTPEDNVILWSSGDTSHLLHELGHAVLGHNSFTRDIELLGMERDAWQKAREIAQLYDISLSDDSIEDDMDTYREWLHARSTCPNCGVNGIQITKDSYLCLVCDTKWHVNDARICNLKRTIVAHNK